MHSNFRFTLALAAIITAAGAGVPFTSSAAGARFYSRNVSVADLDLASPQGQAALNRRVALAALAVCSMSDEPGLAPPADISECRTDTVREGKRSAKRLVAEARQAAAWANARNRTDVHG